MKTMGGFQALNDTDTVLVIKVKSADHTEVRRFYAWLCTGAGAGNGHLIATDLIQLKVIDGYPNNPPTNLTYGTKPFCKSLCHHPQGLSSDVPALMTRTDVSMAAEVVSNITSNDTYIEIAHLEAIFTDIDQVYVSAENTGTHHHTLHMFVLFWANVWYGIQTRKQTYKQTHTQTSTIHHAPIRTCTYVFSFLLLWNVSRCIRDGVRLIVAS